MKRKLLTTGEAYHNYRDKSVMIFLIIVGIVISVFLFSFYYLARSVMKEKPVVYKITEENIIYKPSNNSIGYVIKIDVPDDGKLYKLRIPINLPDETDITWLPYHHAFISVYPLTEGVKTIHSKASDYIYVETRKDFTMQVSFNEGFYLIKGLDFYSYVIPVITFGKKTDKYPTNIIIHVAINNKMLPCNGYSVLVKGEREIHPSPQFSCQSIYDENKHLSTVTIKTKEISDEPFNLFLTVNNKDLIVLPDDKEISEYEFNVVNYRKPFDKFVSEINKYNIELQKAKEKEKLLFLPIIFFIEVFIIAILMVVFAGGEKRIVDKYYINQLQIIEPSEHLPSDSPEEALFYHPNDLYLIIDSEISPEPPSGKPHIRDYKIANILLDKITCTMNTLLYKMIDKGIIEPIIENQKVEGFIIKNRSPEHLSPEEEKFLDLLKKSAITDVSLKESFIKKLFGNNNSPQDEAHRLNEFDDADIILLEELYTFFNKPAYNITVRHKKRNITIGVPQMLTLGSEIYKEAKQRFSVPPADTEEPPIDLPSSYKFYEKIRAVFLAEFYIHLFATFLLFFSLFFSSPYVSVKQLIELEIVIFLISFFLGAVPNPLRKYLIRRKWVNITWWEKFKQWFAVDKWMDIQNDYENLSKEYYQFAITRGYDRQIVKEVRKFKPIKFTSDNIEFTKFEVVSEIGKEVFDKIKRSFVTKISKHKHHH